MEDFFRNDIITAGQVKNELLTRQQKVDARTSGESHHVTKKYPTYQQYYTSRALDNDPRSEHSYKVIERKDVITDADAKYNITRVNIDSRYRNVESKNITEDRITYLSNDPLQFTTGSNLVRVTHPNHGFQVEDKIIVQGIQQTFISLTRGMTFFRDSEFVRINHKNHNLNRNNVSGTSGINIRISNIVGNLDDRRTLLNIPVNELNRIHEIYFTSQTNENPTNDYYYIKLATKVVADLEYSLTPIDIYFLQLAGIPVNELNANFPTSVDQLNGYHIIYSIIDNNHYTIQTTSRAINDTSAGGSNIWITKVVDFIEGYPDNNYYKISLKKTFYNVRKIKLISTEFPNTERVIKNYPLSKKNNMIYWQILQDGADVYSTEITPGNYTLTAFKNELTSKIAKVMRPIMELKNANSDTTKIVYATNNIPVIDVIQQNDIFSMKLLQKITISKPLTLSNNTYTDGFNRMRVYHKDHNLSIDDVVTISNALATNNIPDTVINNTFTIERVLDRDTYEVRLPKYTPNTLQNDITNGGDVVNISYPIRFRLLFDRPYTLGNILGFRNVGKPNSVTQYVTEATNNTPYEGEFGIDASRQTNTINLSGDNYILMTSPIFKEASYSSGKIDGVFAKLLLAGDPGTVMFNQFIQLGESFKVAISTLSEIEVAFYDPTGELFYFNNMEHSYTLEIYEDTSQ
jgi:hypothetical protein